METRLSTKGQIVLPGKIRERLGLKPGDQLDATVDGNRIVLTPRLSRAREPRVTSHPISGFPVLTAGEEAPILTSREVEELLADLR